MALDGKPHETVLLSAFGTGGSFPSQQELNAQIYEALCHGSKYINWWKGYGDAALDEAPNSNDVNYGPVTILAAPANHLDATITVADASSINVGEYVLIGAGGTASTDTGNLQVTKKTGNVLTVSPPVYTGASGTFPYPIGNGVWAAHSHVNAIKSVISAVRACVSPAILGTQLDMANAQAPGSIVTLTPGTVGGVPGLMTTSLYSGLDNTDYLILCNESWFKPYLGTNYDCSNNSKGGNCQYQGIVGGTVGVKLPLVSSTIKKLTCADGIGGTVTATGSGSNWSFTDNYQPLPLAQSFEVYQLLVTATPSATPTVTPTATASGSTTATPSATPTATISATPSRTATPTATITPVGWFPP